MYIYVVIILLLVLLLVLFLRPCKKCNTERFDDTNKGTVFKSTTIYPQATFQRIEKQGKMNEINAQLFDDITFRDVVYYENDLDGRLGLDKCLDNKTGYCVEFGQTGNAYYYPPLATQLNYGQVINIGPVQSHYDKPRTPQMNLVYPALR
jgi:hypothetical protein